MTTFLLTFAFLAFMVAFLISVLLFLMYGWAHRNPDITGYDHYDTSVIVLSYSFISVLGIAGALGMIATIGRI